MKNCRNVLLVDLLHDNWLESGFSTSNSHEERETLSGVRCRKLRRLGDPSSMQEFAESMGSFVGRSNLSKVANISGMSDQRAYGDVVIKGHSAKPAIVRLVTMGVIWVVGEIVIDRLGSLYSRRHMRGIGRSNEGNECDTLYTYSSVQVASSHAANPIGQGESAAKAKFTGHHIFQRVAVLL
jgi:hypothetical protein